MFPGTIKMDNQAVKQTRAQIVDNFTGIIFTLKDKIQLESSNKKPSNVSKTAIAKWQGVSPC